MSTVGFTIRFFMIGSLAALAILAVVVTIIIVIASTKKKKPAPVYYQPQPSTAPQQQEIIKTLGESIKDLRQSRNMTQEYVAESLGVSRQAVSKWENGTSEPSTSNLVAIAKLFEVEPEELLKKLIK